MFGMAKFRSKEMKVDPKEEAGFIAMMKDEHKRAMLLLSRDALRQQVIRRSPELDETAVNDVLEGFDMLREQDPLAVLQEGSLDGGDSGGQLTPFKMAPNFEISMYLAQATGSCIVTDSVFRWRELIVAARRGIQGVPPLSPLRAAMEKAEFVFPQDAREIATLAGLNVFAGYPDLMRKIFRFLSAFPARGAKPNFEASLIAEFRRIHTSTVRVAKKSGAHLAEARVSCLWPTGGIQDNTVNRLLLMSSSEHHLASAPMALYFRRNISDR
jgi:hypothetical protein